MTAVVWHRAACCHWLTLSYLWPGVGGILFINLSGSAGVKLTTSSIHQRAKTWHIGRVLSEWQKQCETTNWKSAQEAVRPQEQRWYTQAKHEQSEWESWGFLRLSTKVQQRGYQLWGQVKERFRTSQAFETGSRRKNARRWRGCTNSVCIALVFWDSFESPEPLSHEFAFSVLKDAILGN